MCNVNISIIWPVLKFEIHSLNPLAKSVYIYPTSLQQGVDTDLDLQPVTLW